MGWDVRHPLAKAGKAPSTAGTNNQRETENMKNITRLLVLGLCALGLSAFAQSASADVVNDIVKRGELRVAVRPRGRR